jgi:hypothetical protein
MTSTKSWQNFEEIKVQEHLRPTLWRIKRLKSSCGLTCDTCWRERCETSSLVCNLRSSGLQGWEFSTKKDGAHCRSWAWRSGVWSWPLKETENSSIYACNDSKWKSQTRAWDGSSGAWAWALREAKSSSVYARSEHISGALDWACTETVCRKKIVCCLLWIDEAKANIKPIYECRCNERL